MKLFDKLEELIEDFKDLLYSFLRRNEPTIPFEEVITQLKRDGQLVDHMDR